MECIFCGNNNILIDNNDVDDTSTITCNNCFGKYYFKKKNKLLLKYPKGTINHSVTLVLILLIIPIGVIILLGLLFLFGDFLDHSYRGESVLNLYSGLMVTYANIILVRMIIFFFQGIYNYIKNGYMVIKDRIITKENSLYSIVFTFLILFITGSLMLILMLYMNISFIRNIFYKNI
jgi:hypothetical protein